MLKSTPGEMEVRAGEKKAPCRNNLTYFFHFHLHAKGREEMEVEPVIQKQP